MECEVVKGFRDGSNLLYVPSEKKLYRLKRKRKNGESDYICYQDVLSRPTKNTPARKEDRNPCNARVRLLTGGEQCKRMNSRHSHHHNHEHIMRDMEKFNEMKEKCETLKNDYPEDASKISTRNIYQRVIKKDGFRNTQLNYHRIKQTLSLHKNKTYPKDPGTVEGIRETFLQQDILKEYGCNLEGDEDFYIDTVVEMEFAFTVFASKFVIDFIDKNIKPKSRSYLMDGTFDSIPKAYYQLLVISIEYNNDIFPAIYCLTTRKTEACYVAVFKYIAENLFNMRPRKIMTDYETGLRAAIRKCWPKVSLHGCWFHLCKAINKRCRKLSMTKLLRTNTNAKRIQKALMSLPLLPVDQIIEGYECIKELARRKKLVQRFKSLFNYFERYWLKQNERNTISVADLNMRTTSPLEAVNSVIQRSFPGQTNIYKFIESLRLYESRRSEDLFKLSTSEIRNRQPQRKRAVDKEREQKIQYFTARLKNGEISTSMFLELMSGKDVLPPVAYKSLSLRRSLRIENKKNDAGRNRQNTLNLQSSDAGRKRRNDSRAQPSEEPPQKKKKICGRKRKTLIQKRK